jgi:sigma-B regulation protein RsbU (phosphoserine phosphatase)
MAEPLKSLKHELRTPLNHIIGYCEMLKDDAEDAGKTEVARDLDRIHDAGRQLLTVINGLFEPAQVERYRRAPALLDHEVRTPLNQIIGYAELLQEEADPASSFAGDLGKIHQAGRLLLAQVVNHLQADRAAWPAPAAHAAPAEPSFARDAVSAPGNPAPQAPIAGVVLVVDDDAGNREVLQRRLARLGHSARGAEDGLAALELLRTEAFDLVLLDLQMPRMNGYEVLAEMKADEDLRGIPVIILSASDELPRVVRCIELGAADYLPKPVEPVLFRARIDACLEKKRLHDREQAAHAALQQNQQHLARELAKAASYVRSLLPEPLSGAVETEWCFEPSEQLGGDAFGYHWIDEDTLSIYLLDVCGHGVGAALLSVSVLNALRAQTLPGVDFHAPEAVLAALNQAFPAAAQNFFYFTMWHGVYRVSTRELRYSSGGHPPALLLTPERVVSLATEGASIGCFSEAQFHRDSTTVGPGDRLLIFSDGVFEIFLEGERVQTWGEFVDRFGDDAHRALRPADRVAFARKLRGADVLEDDFSFVELRFR